MKFQIDGGKHITKDYDFNTRTSLELQVFVYKNGKVFHTTWLKTLVSPANSISLAALTKPA